jgi:hypothetical protein
MIQDMMCEFNAYLREMDVSFHISVAYCLAACLTNSLAFLYPGKPFGQLMR